MGRQYVKHKRSSVVTNGQPKLPTSQQLEVGEIAINFAEGHETLSIINSASGVATFSSDSVLDGKFLTGATINGSAATVTNGNASFSIELGGSGLPEVTAADNGKILQVVNGEWAIVMPSIVYSGNAEPSNSLGNNGDIYLQTGE